MWGVSDVTLVNPDFLLYPLNEGKDVTLVGALGFRIIVLRLYFIEIGLNPRPPRIAPLNSLMSK